VAYVFGIDPIFALMAPEISEEVLVELASLGTGLEISQDSLNTVVAELCG
jgi:aldehyde:ferredoxin oxidoreductase